MCLVFGGIVGGIIGFMMKFFFRRNVDRVCGVGVSNFRIGDNGLDDMFLVL